MVLRYSRFAWLLLACTVLTPVVLITLLNIVIDPYGEYRWLSTSHYRTDLSTVVPLADKLRTGRYAVVFGTSTSAPIDAEAVGEPVLNFSMSIYGSPERIQHFLATLEPVQVENISKIYFAVEYVSFRPHPPREVGFDYGSRRAFWWRTIQNIQRPKILAALDRVIKFATRGADSRLNEFGVYEHLKPRPYTEIRYPRPIVFTHGARQVDYLRAIDAFCQRNGIEFVVFRTVASQYFLANVDLASLRPHFTRVLEAVPSFYSFLWLDGVSDDLTRFRDPIHPTYEAMQAEMQLLNSDERRRYAVSSANLDAYLRFLRGKIRESGDSDG